MLRLGAGGATDANLTGVGGVTGVLTSLARQNSGGFRTGDGLRLAATAGEYVRR